MAKHVFIVLVFLVILSSCVHHKSQQTYIGKNPNDPDAMMAKQRDRPWGDDLLSGAVFAAAAATTAAIVPEKEECQGKCEILMKIECAENPESPLRIPFRHKKISIQNLDDPDKLLAQVYETNQDGIIFLGQAEVSEKIPQNLMISAGGKVFQQKIIKYQTSVLLDYAECKLGK